MGIAAFAYLMFASPNGAEYALTTAESVDSTTPVAGPATSAGALRVDTGGNEAIELFGTTSSEQAPAEDTAEDSTEESTTSTSATDTSTSSSNPESPTSSTAQTNTTSSSASSPSSSATMSPTSSAARLSDTTTTQRSVTTRRTTTTQRTTTTAQATTTTTTRPTTTTTQRTTTTRRTTTTAQATTTTTRPTTTTTQATTTTARPTTSSTTSTSLPPVSGPVVWVDSRAASGGNGSQSAPFRTINQGILAVRAGETLMIKGGDYYEAVNPGYSMPKGTASSPIVMRNAPGERVLIRGRVLLTDPEYWTISGINVTWDNSVSGNIEHMIMFKGGRNWEFRDAEVWGAKAYSAILIGDDPVNFALRNLHVHDTYPTNDTNQDHLIYCACGTGGGVIERNLLVGSANGRAVKLGPPNASRGSVGNVTVRYNTMVDNLGPSSIQLSFNTYNITMERNLMVSTKPYAANISTYELTGGGSRAANNLGWDSPQGTLESHWGIADGGGNIHRDPRLDGNYVPQDSVAKAYGHRAP